MNKTFSENLKKYRTEKSLTQEKAAELLGVSAQCVSRWECGQTLPDALMLPRIAEVYAVTVDGLYKKDFAAYDNYAQRLASLYETSRDFWDFARANQEFEKLEKENGLSAEDLRVWGASFCKLEEFAKNRALLFLKRAMEKSKGKNENLYFRAYAQAVDLQISSGDTETILKELRSKTAEDKGNSEMFALLLFALNRAKKYEECYEAFSQAKQTFRNDWKILTMGGDICWNIGKQEEAFRYWNKAIELNPPYAVAKYSKAMAYESLGEKEKAYQIWLEIAAELRREGFGIEAGEEEQRAK